MVVKAQVLRLMVGEQHVDACALRNVGKSCDRVQLLDFVRSRRGDTPPAVNGTDIPRAMVKHWQDCGERALGMSRRDGEEKRRITHEHADHFGGARYLQDSVSHCPATL